MSGPTNRRFVRSAWTLLAFQFVAAGGALALAFWAATRVQHLVDQRDLLQARVTALEARQSHVQAPPPVEEAPALPPVLVAPAPAPVPAQARSSTPPPVAVHRGGSESLPPPVIVDQGPPPRPPRPVHIPALEPPAYLPPREPPSAHVPPRRPPAVVRPDVPAKPVGQPASGAPPRPARPSGTLPPIRQAAPPAIVRPARPNGVIAVRPGRPTQSQAVAPPATRPGVTVQRIAPARIRRPRPVETAPQPNPPK